MIGNTQPNPQTVKYIPPNRGLTGGVGTMIEVKNRQQNDEHRWEELGLEKIQAS